MIWFLYIESLSCDPPRADGLMCRLTATEVPTDFVYVIEQGVEELHEEYVQAVKYSTVR